MILSAVVVLLLETVLEFFVVFCEIVVVDPNLFNVILRKFLCGFLLFVGS